MISDSLRRASRIRIALVGCGRISRNHIKSIAIHSDRAELVALCDTDEHRIVAAQSLVAEAAKVSSIYMSSRSINGYDKLLSAIKSHALEVDLIVLTSPSGFPGSGDCRCRSWCQRLHRETNGD